MRSTHATSGLRRLPVRGRRFPKAFGKKSRICASTGARGRMCRARASEITCGSLVVERAGENMRIGRGCIGIPSRIRRSQAWKLLVVVSVAGLVRPISAASSSASAAPTRKVMIVPALPKTACWSEAGNWETCWFAAISAKPPLSALGEDGRKAFCREVLKFVEIQGEVASLGFRDVPSSPRRLGKTP